MPLKVPHVVIKLPSMFFYSLLSTVASKNSLTFLQKLYWNYFQNRQSPVSVFYDTTKKVSITYINGGISWQKIQLKLTYIHFWAQKRLLNTMIYFFHHKYFYFLDPQKFNQLFTPLILTFFKLFYNQNLACTSGKKSGKNY